MSNFKLKKKGDQNVEQLSNLDHLTTNASPSQCEVPLYIFEDNEAGDQDDHQRTKSNAEVCVKNPQSRVRLVV